MNLFSITFLEAFIVFIVCVMIFVAYEMSIKDNPKRKHKDSREDEYWNGKIQ